jgi:predicted dehydrogenase
LTAQGFTQRKIDSEPLRGTMIDVEVPTTVQGLLEFQHGGVATIITSFDVVGRHSLPRIEVHGTEGSLSVPDPNTFGGPVRLARRNADHWEDVPLAFGYEDNSRGVGVADLAAAAQTGRPHRASGELATHVLELMHGFHRSAEENVFVEPSVTCAQPAPLPTGLEPWTLDGV